MVITHLLRHLLAISPPHHPALASHVAATGAQPAMCARSHTTLPAPLASKQAFGVGVSRPGSGVLEWVVIVSERGLLGGVRATHI